MYAIPTITPSGTLQHTATLVLVTPFILPVTVGGVNYAPAVATDGTLSPRQTRLPIDLSLRTPPPPRRQTRHSGATDAVQVPPVAVMPQ